jgi:hypothetical protein
MPCIPGFSYDIFLSYAHLDNQGLGNNAGWIERFYQHLDVLLRQLLGTNDVRIWWDHQKLDGTKLFDQSIQAGINGSAIFLCLTSRGYLNSHYCHKELDLFHTKAAREITGLRINDRSRIIHVLLQNIPYTDPGWPSQFQGTTGFPFYLPVTDPEDLGFPLQLARRQGIRRYLFERAVRTLRRVLRWV